MFKIQLKKSILKHDVIKTELSAILNIVKQCKILIIYNLQSRY